MPHQAALQLITFNSRTADVHDAGRRCFVASFNKFP